MAVIKMSDIDLSGKRVLIREDLNVPVADGQVTSDARIQAALPTIRAALDAGAAVMVMSHLGRPTEGMPEEKFSLQPVAEHLSGLLGRTVPLVRDWIDGVDVEPGQIVLLENVRFLEGEKKCDEGLARKMANLARDENYRLIHTHTPRAALIGQLASVLSGIPMVHHVHSPSDRDTESGWRNVRNSLIEQFSLLRARVLIPVSASLEQYLCS